MVKQNADNAAHSAMTVISVPAGDYWRLVDQATAFADLADTVQIIEEMLCEQPDEPEAHHEAWESFFLACSQVFAPKAPVFGDLIESAAFERERLARERLARQRRSEFCIVK
jgi:hypothetical protein